MADRKNKREESEDERMRQWEIGRERGGIERKKGEGKERHRGDRKIDGKE